MSSSAGDSGRGSNNSDGDMQCDSDEESRASMSDGYDGESSDSRSEAPPSEAGSGDTDYFYEAPEVSDMEDYVDDNDDAFEMEC